MRQLHYLKTSRSNYPLTQYQFPEVRSPQFFSQLPINSLDTNIFNLRKLKSLWDPDTLLQY